LPRIFPPFPDILRFDIYATMEAAREVGGDFYDFFLIGDESNPDNGKLGFVVADVSGKGVPAALFMMKAKTQIRDYMNSGMELGEAFENVNRQLCDGNDASMFVTAWAGVLDYTTGHVDFVSAGHNPPLIWQLSDARWHWLKEKSGLPLGLFDGMPYTAHSIECQVGDQFLLYTDGVTEAMDTRNEQYGENRLKAIADENYPMHPRELVKTVRSDVAAFAGEAEQSDDITILALEVGVPPEITATLVIPADVKELPQVNEFIHDELDRRLCPMRAQNQLDIAVEELFVNVAHYAYPEATPDNPGMARVSYTYSADPPSITVDIADDGIPYNPLAKPDAVTPDDIMEVPIGGLGILMAKRSVDEMRYARVDGSNIVTIVKKW
ncbi:MAG: SpoIIE family protein phosphatase, partial [Eggerthellaceae bacterium]|nr:SpoIIE family protein phosphatase [Eggerthellaceae bacterium]